MKEKYVYRLIHEIEVENNGEFPVYERKLLGYFVSARTAEHAIEKYKEITGFKDYPNGFVIQKEKVIYDNSQRDTELKEHRIYELTQSFEDECGYETVEYFPVYASYQAALHAKDELSKKEPYSLHPDGLLIAEYDLDNCYWQYGFDKV